MIVCVCVCISLSIVLQIAIGHARHHAGGQRWPVVYLGQPSEDSDDEDIVLKNTYTEDAPPEEPEPDDDEEEDGGGEVDPLPRDLIRTLTLGLRPRTRPM